LWPLAWVLAVLVAGPVHGQATNRWKPPPNPLELDFTVPSPARRTTLSEDGFALEIAADFMMVKHAELLIEARLPEKGKFVVVQENAQALVDVSEQIVKGNTGLARLATRLPAYSLREAVKDAQAVAMKIGDPALEKKFLEEAQTMSAADLRSALQREGLADVPEGKNAEARLRAAYARQQALKQLLPKYREKLLELAKRRPDWVTDKDKARWERNLDRAVFDDYQTLLELEQMDQYLKRCGLESETNAQNVKAKLMGRMEAVHLLISGTFGEAPSVSASGAMKALTGQEVKAIRNALEVQLRCRFVPETDPADPNAQWFNGQRVACRAHGVASIQLVGKLDPGAHDRVDWWILDGYDSAAVVMDPGKSAAYRVDPPYPVPGGAALRVAATGDEPAPYTIEFRPAARVKGELRVMVHESPGAAKPKFPY
jgi:hypothetical protein